MEQLRARGPHLNAEDAENRVKSQTDVRDKARRAEERGDGKGTVLRNDGTKEEFSKQLESAMAQMQRGHPDWWSWLMLGCPLLAALVAARQYYQNIQINKRWTARTNAKL